MLAYFEVFLIIYQSGTVQAAINAKSTSFIVLRVFQLLIASFFCIKGFAHKNQFSKATMILFILENLALINYFLYPNSVLELQYRIFLLIIFYGMIEYFNQRVDILKIFYDIIIIIALITMGMYVIVGLLRLPLPYSIMHIPGGVYYKNYFNIFYTYSEKTIPRICGLFWEPGVYQIYLNMALFIYLAREKKEKGKLLLLLISILFTQSTTGYMLAAIICGAIFIRNNLFTKDSKMAIKIIIPLSVLMFVAFAYISKRQETNIVGDSYNLRIRDIFNSLSLFIEHPILGTGFYNTSEFARLDEFGRGNSNGLFTWLYTTGIVGMLFAIIPFLNNIYHSKDKIHKTNHIVLFIFVLVINLSEPIYNLAFMVLILAYAYYMAMNKVELGKYGEKLSVR